MHVRITYYKITESDRPSLLFNRGKYWEEKEPFKISTTLLEHPDTKPEIFLQFSKLFHDFLW